MFESIVIILPRLLLVYIGFSIYRKFFGWDVLEQQVIGRSGRTIPGAPRTQQGYIFLKGPRGKQTGKAKFRKLEGDFKAPWGW
jgi:hypothetical protein